MLAGYWNIDRRIYHYVHLVNIYLPAQRHIYMSLVRFLRKDIPVKKLEESCEDFLRFKERYSCKGTSTRSG